MIPKALRSFIFNVQQATERDQIKWIEADAGSYFCDHKENTLHINYHFDSEFGASSFHFRIVLKGKSTPFMVRDTEEEDYQTMANLYETVIANANLDANDLKGFFD